MRLVTDPVLTFAEALSAEGGLKLWSLIVTVLGDRAQAGHPELSGPDLSELIRRIGLQPQAMRVALHRLNRDGWLDSRRDGRISHYRLSETAIVRMRAVHERVYGSGASGSFGLRLVVAPPQAESIADGLPHEVDLMEIDSRTALMFDDRAVPSPDLIHAPYDPKTAPEWLMASARDAALHDALDRLGADIATLAGALDDETASPLTRSAARVLVLHGWRRLILRANPVANALLAATGRKCGTRAIVLAALSRWPVRDRNGTSGLAA